MPKYVIEDIIRTKRIKKETKDIKKEVFTKTSDPEKKTLIKNSKTNTKYTLWFVAFGSILFFIFALSFLFSKAKINISPKTEDIVLSENFSASKEATNGNLFFDLVVISGEEKNTIQATEEKEVSEKATGTVVIFNFFSSAPQRLDIDTRLEGSNGKLYKTQTKTIVPGMAKDGTPGSVEVGIYGAGAGGEYNSGPIDFQILGFKGSPKYDKFKTRTKTGTEIKGGYVGKAPVVSEAEKSSAVSSIKNALREKLLQKAIGQTPKGFILFNEAIFLNINENEVSIIYNDDNSMTLVEKGTLYGLLFSEQKLTKKIAEKKISDYDGSEVYIPNIENLKFSLSNQDNVSFNDVKNISFNLSGSAKIVWKLDEKKFIDSLLNKSKKDFVKISSQYENIDSADLKMFPPWRDSIPPQSKNVKVIVNYPK
jgi:hypothetical protein